MSFREIARRAGVSPSTVSRIVNSKNVSAASPQTQERIWAAVRELGYVPNQHARQLKRPELDQKPQNQNLDCVYARTIGPYLDPFFTVLMRAAEITAFDAGYNLRYHYSVADIQDGKAPFTDTNSDSAVVLGRIEPRSLSLLKKWYKNIVNIGQNSAPDGIFDQVICSGYQAVRTCVEYLRSLGHKKICYMGETDNEQRFQSYLDAMADLELGDLTPYVARCLFNPTDGYEATNRLLDSGVEFTAILCANDMNAVGAMKSLREHRLKVPQDVSIIGINDMETVCYLDPMLTTIHVPLEEMGHLGVKLLIDRIEGGHTSSIKVDVPFTLIQRESCGPAKKRY